MNQEIIDMAKQAGWEYAHDNSGYEPLWKFAALVAAAERERLAYAEGFTTTAALLAQAKQCEPTKVVLARSIFK